MRHCCRRYLLPLGLVLAGALLPAGWRRVGDAPPARPGPFRELHFANRVSSLAFSADGGTLAVATAGYMVQDGSLALVDVRRGRTRCVLSRGSRTLILGLLQDGETLAALHETGHSLQAFGFWGIHTGRPMLLRARGLRGISKSWQLIGPLLLSPNGRLLAESPEYNWTAGAHLRDLQGGTTRPPLAVSGAVTAAACFTPDGRHLVVAAAAWPGVDAGICQLYDVRPGRRPLWSRLVPACFPPRPPATWRRENSMEYARLVFSADGRRFALASDEAGVAIGDAATGRVLAWLEEPGDGPVALSPDGGMLAVAESTSVAAAYRADRQRDSARIRLYDLPSGRRRSAWRAFDAECTALAFSPGGRLLAAGCEDGTVTLWRVPQLLSSPPARLSSAAARQAERVRAENAARPTRSTAERRRLTEELERATDGPLFRIDTDLIECLVAGGADPNVHVIQGDYSWPPVRTLLTEAARDGHTERIRVLLEHGADPNVRDGPGRTALLAAVLSCLPEAARVLVEHGADVNIADRNGITPLAAAAYRGNAFFVAFLLQHGARPNVRDRFGKSPIEWAAYYGHDDVVGLLRRPGAVAPAGRPLRGPAGRRLDEALIAAAEEGTPAAMAALAARGADPNATVLDGTTEIWVRSPLLAAVGAHSEKRVRFLLNHGADPNQWVGESLLSDCLMGNDPPDLGLLRLLLARGADVNLPDAGGATPLMAAAINGVEATRLLLAHGAKVNARSLAGTSALIAASHLPRPTEPADPETVALLLAHGADPNVRDHWGSAPTLSASVRRRRSPPVPAASGQPRRRTPVPASSRPRRRNVP